MQLIKCNSVIKYVKLLRQKIFHLFTTQKVKDTKRGWANAFTDRVHWTLIKKISTLVRVKDYKKNPDQFSHPSGQRVLEPIIFLRAHLLGHSRDPTSPLLEICSHHANKSDRFK